MTQDPQATAGEQPRSGVRRAASEIGSELKRLATLGAYEMGAALQAFPPGESAYRGDLGMLSHQQAGQSPPGNLDTLGAAQGTAAHLPTREPEQRHGLSL